MMKCAGKQWDEISDRLKKYLRESAQKCFDAKLIGQADRDKYFESGTTILSYRVTYLTKIENTNKRLQSV